jgi:hypothetical protein
LEVPGLDGRIMSNGFSRSGLGHYWIDLAQDRDRWRGLANAVTNLRVP